MSFISLVVRLRLLFPELLNGVGIIDGPMKNANAAPKMPAKVPIAVAVVRSLGGNQVLDTNGGAPVAMKLGSMVTRWPT